VVGRGIDLMYGALGRLAVRDLFCLGNCGLFYGCCRPSCVSLLACDVTCISREHPFLITRLVLVVRSAAHPPPPPRGGGGAGVRRPLLCDSTYAAAAHTD
jgi:hypothetical protein